ncbi:hypothetical protein D9M72_339760 [compost metagenome]
MQQAAGDFRLAAPRQLVLHHQPRDALAAGAGHLQHVLAAAERVWQLLRGIEHLRIGCARGHDEAAADRQVARLAQRCTAGVEGMELHAVGMLGHGLAPVEGDVLLLDEGHDVLAQQGQLAAGAQRGQLLVDGIGIDGVGRLPHQAEDHALVGAVTLAGGAQRAVQLHAHAGHLRQQAIALKPLRKHQGRAHRAHGMRARRADAHLEQIENADCHGKSPGCRWPVQGSCRFAAFAQNGRRTARRPSYRA